MVFSAETDTLKLAFRRYGHGNKNIVAQICLAFPGFDYFGFDFVVFYTNSLLSKITIAKNYNCTHHFKYLLRTCLCFVFSYKNKNKARNQLISVIFVISTTLTLVAGISRARVSLVIIT